MPGQFVDREHFLRSASRVVRVAVVDFIRRRHAQSRGGDLMKVTLSTEFGDHAGHFLIRKASSPRLGLANAANFFAPPMSGFPNRMRIYR